MPGLSRFAAIEANGSLCCSGIKQIVSRSLYYVCIRKVQSKVCALTTTLCANRAQISSVINFRRQKNKYLLLVSQRANIWSLLKPILKGHRQYVSLIYVWNVWEQIGLVNYKQKFRLCLELHYISQQIYSPIIRLYSKYITSSFTSPVVVVYWESRYFNIFAAIYTNR